MLPFLLLLLLLLKEASSASNNGLSDELRFIHQEMGTLKDENHKQNMEIASLKETVQLQNKTINQHEITIKRLVNDDHKMVKNDLQLISAGKTRRKRPAQLIPVSKLSGEPIGDNDQPNPKQFYGPPTNCSDLSRLGYTLNGFYLVKNPLMDAHFPQATRLETVYCAFMQKGIYKPFLVQQTIIKPPSFINPFPYSSTSSPLKLSKEIFKTTKATGNGNCSARMGHLVNGFGKSIRPYADSTKSGYTLHQGQADSISWSWNEASLGSGDGHLCNTLGKCATSYKIDPVRPQEPSFVRQEDYTNKEGQIFYFLELQAHPGFFIIKDVFGKCVAIYGNTDRNMAEVRAINCDHTEAGQRWKWSYP